MTTVILDNIWKEYGDQIVLERLNLSIASGSFVALVGPSGCGKTTLLKMLLGEEKPSKGQILLDGKPLRPEPDSDRGVVFQRYSVFPHLTVLGNVLVGLEFQGSPILGRLFGIRRLKAIEEARGLISAVGLSGHEDKYPAALSGGMQQRLALAQTLIRRPKVLLLDEPFGALDPGIRAEIHALTQKLWSEQGITVVMVTHDLSEAFLLGTRVIALERLRKQPEDAARYGATVTQDIEVWPKKVPKALNGATHPSQPLLSDLSPQPM